MKYEQSANAFSIPVRVYYEDTDAGGVVYYANYLKFFERCRHTRDMPLRRAVSRRLGFREMLLTLWLRIATSMMRRGTS